MAPRHAASAAIASADSQAGALAGLVGLGTADQDRPLAGPGHGVVGIDGLQVFPAQRHQLVGPGEGIAPDQQQRAVPKVAQRERGAVGGG
ncbi:hypothetical protein [Azospirillum sp. Sp 7]|uniref:hypothetical protein n=1 Tax=Azospirillum sp. Sp 7 TaxID=1685931 RepID=UPI0011B23607|nr:hypothetical protein [Azospirillum sp. Sp 7]